MPNPVPLTRLQQFLLANHGLLSIQRLAAFLGVPEAQLTEWNEALGLPRVDAMDQERAFPLVVRRNHVLLPRDEIIRLLGMTTDQYLKSVLDMDFLDIKLGNPPPGLAPIDLGCDRFDETAAESFRRHCGAYFADHSDWERPFQFAEELGVVEPPFDGSPRTASLNPAMFYCYTGTHGDSLLTGEDFYNEGILSRLANRGVNAVWISVLLRDLAPGGVFPELGEGHEIRIANLRGEVEKAARYGIKLYLYLNEPRFLPEEFFQDYPDSKGMRGLQPGYYGMCTSDERVRTWLYESAKYVFTQVPDLGGVFLITASENETNCYSHVTTIHQNADNMDELFFGTKDGEAMCPRCRQRRAVDVLADAANILQQAANDAQADAEIIQWLWGWDYIAPLDEVKSGIAALDPKIAIMIDWAKYTEFELYGKTGQIHEYTLAHTKPSDYTLHILEACRGLGRKIISKACLVTTLQMGALPYLPVLMNVEDVLRELKKHGVSGIQGSWIFGAYPARNMEMLALAGDESPARALATKYYGSGADAALEAWRSFSEGMRYYPSIITVLYQGAVSCGPGLGFPLDPRPWQGGMLAVPSENVEQVCQPLGVDVVIRGFREVAEYFRRGLEHLDRAIEPCDRDDHRDENLRDRRVCEAAMLHLLIAANYAEFLTVRDAWLHDQTNESLRARLVDVLQTELSYAERILPIVKADSRLGYEGSIGYYYTPSEIIEKIYDLRVSLHRLS